MLAIKLSLPPQLICQLLQRNILRGTIWKPGDAIHKVGHVRLFVEKCRAEVCVLSKRLPEIGQQVIGVMLRRI